MCWRTWAMRELAWVKAFPQIKHWHGFSPGETQEKVGGEHEGKENPSRRQDQIRTGVDADVALERAGVGELALAVHAHVRLLPAVDPQVPLQVTWEQGRLKDTGSSSPFSSFPEPQKLPRERLVLFREQGLRKD